MTSLRLQQAACVTLMLAACASGCVGGEQSYLPLKEGRTWYYTAAAGDLFGGSEMVVTNLPPRDLGGRSVVPRKVDVDGQTSFVFVGQDDSGYYEYAKQDANDTEPVVSRSPSYYLRHPAVPGTSWQDTAVTWRVRVPLTVTVESASEVVTVPAGTFENCLKVVSRGSAHRDLGSIMGPARIDVERQAWYAPGVGLVRAVFRETHPQIMGWGRTLTLQESTLQLDSVRR